MGVSGTIRLAVVSQTRPVNNMSDDVARFQEESDKLQKHLAFICGTIDQLTAVKKHIEVRHQRAESQDQRAFKYSLHLRLMTTDGMLNMFRDLLTAKLQQFTAALDPFVTTDRDGVGAEMDGVGVSEDDIEQPSVEDEDILSHLYDDDDDDYNEDMSEDEEDTVAFVDMPSTSASIPRAALPSVSVPKIVTKTRERAVEVDNMDEDAL